MINYELACQLKNEGFPQKPKLGSKYWIDDKLYSVTLNDFFKSEEHYPLKSPTLEELIEACGWRFVCLGKSLGDQNDWYACSGGRYKESEDELKYDLLKNGDTPSEAVAHLWLELNKNKT